LIDVLDLCEGPEYIAIANPRLPSENFNCSALSFGEQSLPKELEFIFGRLVGWWRWHKAPKKKKKRRKLGDKLYRIRAATGLLKKPVGCSAFADCVLRDSTAAFNAQVLCLSRCAISVSGEVASPSHFCFCSFVSGCCNQAPSAAGSSPSHFFAKGTGHGRSAALDAWRGLE
jgi:hypothetical protein